MPQIYYFGMHFYKFYLELLYFIFIFNFEMHTFFVKPYVVKLLLIAYINVAKIWF